MYRTGACHWLFRAACCWYLPEVSLGSSDVVGHGHGYRSSRPWLERVPVVTGPTAQELTADTSLPDQFDWRNVNGRSFVTTDLNQHIPIYCGACWIHGTVHALNDRIKIMRDGRYPEVLLSRQAIMNCVPDPSKQGPPPGCNGGDVWMIHKYLHEHKVPDESCMPYVAVNQACEPTNICRNCVGKPDPVTKLMQPDHCMSVPRWAGYGVGDYGNLSGEDAMMREIYARGPITCGFVTDPTFMYNYSENQGVQEEGVYKTNKEVYTQDQIDHMMEVAGWGTTAAGTRYWVVRNSWGTYWGDMGWLKVQRGVNELFMESECDWAVPDLSDLNEQLKSNVLGDYVLGTRNAGPRIGGAFESEQYVPPASWRWSAAAVALAAAGAASLTAGLFLARREAQHPWLQRGLLG